MNNRFIKALNVFLSTLLVIASFFIYIPYSHALANQLTTVSILPSNSIVSTTGVSYAVTFTPGDTTSIQCVQIKFATTVSLGTPASGMSTASGLTSVSGGLTTGTWANYGSAAAGTLQIDASSGQTVTLATATITWSGVQNTSISGTPIFAQITTYTTNSSHVCSGQVDQSPIMALLFNSAGLTTNVTVAPTLTFSVADYGSAVNASGDTPFVTTTNATIPFGTVAAGSLAYGSQTLTTSTNAAHGYIDYVSYSGQMTDANSDTFANTTGSNGTPAAWSGSASVSAFGYTTDGNGYQASFSGPAKWAALAVGTSTGPIASRTAAVNADVAHVQYRIQPSNTQPPGTYSTTVIYTAVPSY